MKKQIILFGFAFAIATGFTKSKANNLILGGPITIVSSNQIRFTIMWDNSWFITSSSPNNWDAVWIFVKYKDCATSNWLHAPLSTTLADHTVSGGGGLLSIEMPSVNDGTGVLIRRTASGGGNIATAETVTLKLNGITTGTYNFSVFGVEMVNVPQGDFQVGDGTSAGTFSNNTITAAIQASGISAATLGGTGTVNVPSTYPMGQSALYCMKYEISQEQYVDFLNTLTYDQQATRTVNNLPNAVAGTFVMGSSTATAGRNRNSVKVKTSGAANTIPAVYGNDLNDNRVFNEAADGLSIACNYLSWADLAAYLDWACLRPMTDLEFEKICRGVNPRIANEYVWGSTSITQAKSYTTTGCTSGLTNPGAANELSTASGNGLAAYGAADGACVTGAGLCDIANATFGSLRAGVLRVGFAATATTDRTTAAATYGGVLDMGGNVWERVVAVNAAGVTYTGVLGDGALTTAGEADVTNWPGTTAAGTGYRGSSWVDAAQYLKTSDRSFATTTLATRVCNLGGRGLR